MSISENMIFTMQISYVKNSPYTRKWTAQQVYAARGSKKKYESYGNHLQIEFRFVASLAAS